MWCGCGTHYMGVWLVGGAFVPEGPSKKLAPMGTSVDRKDVDVRCIIVSNLFVLQAAGETPFGRLAGQAPKFMVAWISMSGAKVIL